MWMQNLERNKDVFMKKRICTFRMDDITPAMNWERFRKIEDLFKKYDIRPLIGVVPDNRDPKLSPDEECSSFWEEVKRLEKEGWMLCQHGYQHVYVTKDGGLIRKNMYSEFAGLSYEEQYDKLSKGKQELEAHGVYTKIFMAPAHSFDENTLKALANLGFTTITDGYTSYPYRRQGLVFYPCTMFGRGGVRGLDTICLHANTTSDEDIATLDEFIRENREIIYSYDDMMKETQSMIKNRGWKVSVDEWIAIEIRELKKHITNSNRMHCYMQKTYDSNPVKKMLKRIFFFPLLFTKLEDK